MPVFCGDMIQSPIQFFFYSLCFWADKYYEARRL
jgi:hypothetical protein